MGLPDPAVLPTIAMLLRVVGASPMPADEQVRQELMYSCRRLLSNIVQ
jgi:hypothetical protein